VPEKYYKGIQAKAEKVKRLVCKTRRQYRQYLGNRR
jgi:hypothetical protein